MSRHLIDSMMPARANRRISWSLSYAAKYGLDSAAFGISRDHLTRLLRGFGFTDRGLTMRRVLRAYDEQIARR